ncbi:hypothetical protein DPMN_110186 [Dreissena polymorpha]|uniref:Uncharacterized protein n=1 Tax=Dreissena polymorpha TaxID=45954 RepID=A0A9D4KBY3_DREPO|nr:hypothetical protein DPMN_110186 [Dreissena polymorpha]
MTTEFHAQVRTLLALSIIEWLKILFTFHKGGYALMDALDLIRIVQVDKAGSLQIRFGVVW